MTGPSGERDPFAADVRLAAVERRYREHVELYSYSTRAVEVLRHEWVADRIQALRPSAVLDLGCSQGQLTRRLAGRGYALVGMDLSPTALGRARSALDAIGASSVPLLCGDSTNLPVGDGTCDVVVASDGPGSWDISAAQRAAAYAEIHRVLRPGGHVLITEHLRPARFAEFVAEVAASPLAVVRVEYLYDRPWYQFESWFRAIQHTSVGQAIRRNLAIARLLTRLGSFFGPRASRHICILARRG